MSTFVSPDVQFTVQTLLPAEAEKRTFTIRMSARSWAELQDHWQLENLDLAVAKVSEMEAGQLHARDLGAIMWAALRTHHPDVTVEDAFTLVDDLGIPAFMSLMVRCANVSVPEGGGKASANPPRWPWSRGR